MSISTHRRSTSSTPRRGYLACLCMLACLLIASFGCTVHAPAAGTAVSGSPTLHENPGAAEPAAAGTLDARPAPEHLKKQLGDILAGEEYQRQMRDAQPDLSARIIEAIIDFIARVLAPLLKARDAMYNTSPVIYWGIVSILTVIIILLIYHIFITISGAFREPAKKRSLMGVELPPRKAANELREAADRAANSGDFAQAIIYMYLAALVHLDQREIIRFRDADTNRQLLLQLRAEPELMQRIEPLSLKVETISYGHHPATHADFEHAGRVVGEVLAR